MDECQKQCQVQFTEDFVVYQLQSLRSINHKDCIGKDTYIWNMIMVKINGMVNKKMKVVAISGGQSGM